MIAAIYARKSTDQTGVADEQKSVTRQIEHATTYAERRGWLVAEEHVYVDDGISGAEFANRPGFLRLMNALKPRPAFQVLVMSEESRLGREAIETAYALKQLVTAGVRVFFYLEDRERTLDSPTDKIMMSLTAFADELEREKARQRTYDAMLRKAKAGHVTGGRVFGYDNLRIDGSHVERRINDAEAAIVRQIFRLSAEGFGMKSIAKRLNAEGAVSPRAQQGRSQSWAPTSVREVLFRELYRGLVVWNQTRKRDSWGHKHQHARPADEWINRPAPELRLVSDDEWQSAHARMDRARAVYSHATNGQPFGRPALGSPSKYLLTNLALCGGCGGTLEVLSRSHGKSGRKHFYGCSAHHERGMCANRKNVPMLDGDDIVIEALLDDVLDEGLLSESVDEALVILQGGHDTAAMAEQLKTELMTVDRERGRVLAAAKAGERISGLLEALQTLTKRQEELQAQRDAIARRTGLSISDCRHVRDELLELASSWRQVLVDDPNHARPIVSSLLKGRVTFTPLAESKQWQLRGEGTLIGLFTREFTGRDGVPNGIRALPAIPFSRTFRAA